MTIRHIRFIRVLLIMILTFTGVASADIGGKRVILIHGFNPFQLLSPPSDNGQADAQNYWQTVDARFRSSTSQSNVIYWPSNKRLTGAGGIISIVQPQLKALIETGYCDNDCVIVTHSTGDLVTRFILKNRTSLFGSELASRFGVAAVIDLAGAGGGTELANYGVGLANGVNFAGDVIEALLDYAGFQVHFGLNVGVMNDLQPSVARNHATNGFPSIPHLRMVGTGDEFYGFATHPLIWGADDSVVPVHSACGAAQASGYESCSRAVYTDGLLGSVSNAPSLSQLYDYHYPLIMSDDIPHNEMQSNARGNAMTYVTEAANDYQQGPAYDLPIGFAYKEVRYWWEFWNKYRYIRDAESRSMSTLIADSL